MLTLEQQGNKVQCPKSDHSKKPIISICLHPTCHENQLICIKCKPQHELHQSYVFTLMQIQEFLLKNNQIDKAVHYPLTQEIITNFAKYKQEVLTRLNIIEQKLQSSIEKLNENKSIQSISLQCLNLKTQLNYESLKRIASLLQQTCTFDQNLQKLFSNEMIEKYHKQKPMFVSAINNLQKLVLSITQTFEITKPINTKPSTKQQQVIKRYEQVATDTDGTLTIKPLKCNRMIICNFLVEQTCDLVGFYQPFLYKGKDIDYQLQQLKCIYKIHLGLDLQIRAFEFNININHTSMEKPNTNCYLIKLPETFRLISGQVYTISMTIQDNQSFSISYQKLSEQNNILKFQFPKISQFKFPKEIKEIDDYGYFPCLQII